MILAELVGLTWTVNGSKLHKDCLVLVWGRSQFLRVSFLEAPTHSDHSRLPRDAPSACRSHLHRLAWRSVSIWVCISIGRHPTIGFGLCSFFEYIANLYKSFPESKEWEEMRVNLTSRCAGEFESMSPFHGSVACIPGRLLSSTNRLSTSKKISVFTRQSGKVLCVCVCVCVCVKPCFQGSNLKQGDRAL